MVNMQNQMNRSFTEFSMKSGRIFVEFAHFTHYLITTTKNFKNEVKSPPAIGIHSGGHFSLSSMNNRVVVIMTTIVGRLNILPINGSCDVFSPLGRVISSIFQSIPTFGTRGAESCA